MNPKLNYLILFSAIVFLVSTSADAFVFEDLLSSSASITGFASRCFPDYVCGYWGQCEEGIQARSCNDQKCGRRDIIERRFCNLPGCRPKIECLEWSECIYTEKVTNLIEGKIGFGGYHNRICRDVNGCVESFLEEKPCEEFFPLKIEKKFVCDEEFLVASDPTSRREVAKIDLEAWQNEQKLNIVFSQGEKLYCPSCYNGDFDEGEEKVDCGGECKSCEKRRVFPSNLAMLAFWIFSGVFTLLFVREIILMRKLPNISYRSFLR